MPMDYKRPDMKEVIARLVDDSYFLELGTNYGSSMVSGHAKIEGLPVDGHRWLASVERSGRLLKHPGLLLAPGCRREGILRRR